MPSNNHHDSSLPVALAHHTPSQLHKSEQYYSRTDEANDQPGETQSLLHRPPVLEDVDPAPASSPARAWIVRALALCCACSLSVGSHYASYTLGPLKSRLSRDLGTSNTEFSLLISAFSLNSTWTPLVGGYLAGKLGTTYTSILATGAIFTGQALLLLGDILENVRLMAFGLFIFGLGVSPLAVVQEAIIVRFFRYHGLGMSMALGLVAGKGASFLSARTSYPLSERFGRHAPFYASTLLTLFSVIINLVYIAASRWLVTGAGVEMEAAELGREARRTELLDASEARALKQVAEKRRVNLKEVSDLGDVFWAYIGVNVLCGTIWHPFTHLAANIFERRYDLSESDASTQASYLLAGSIFLYPLCGYIIDRLNHPQSILRLFALSSVLTMLCYVWLALPPSWTHIPAPGIATFASGFGFSPLLLVVMVPQLVPLKYVSTTLGAHKSLEQTGSTIFQTLAGIILDARNPSHAPPPEDTPEPPRSSTSALQHLLYAFLLLNVLQWLSILALTYLDRQRKRSAEAHAMEHDAANATVIDLDPHDACSAPAEVQADEDIDEDDTNVVQLHPPSLDISPLLSPYAHAHAPQPSLALAIGSPVSDTEIRRGRFFTLLCAGLICIAWVLFLVTAYLRLRSKNDRETYDGAESKALMREVVVWAGV